MGVSSDFNEALPNTGMALSTRRNTLFPKGYGGMEQHSDLRLSLPPTTMLD